MWRDEEGRFLLSVWCMAYMHYAIPVNFQRACMCKAVVDVLSVLPDAPALPIIAACLRLNAAVTQAHA